MLAKFLAGEFDFSTKLLLLAILYVTSMMLIPMIWNWLRYTTKGKWWAKMAGPVMFFVAGISFGVLLVLWFLPCA